MPKWYRSLAEKIARFRRLPVHTHPYLFKMMFSLTISRLALRVIPFRWLTRFFEYPPRLPRDSFTERQGIGASVQPHYTVHQNEILGTERERLIKYAWWLIKEAAWFLPGETNCFPQSIAAHLFLRRLGMGTTLYYGAATLPKRGLTAHVWVQDGNDIIVGRHNRQEYHILARYPETN
jgi:hypothetical protein